MVVFKLCIVKVVLSFLKSTLGYASKGFMEPELYKLNGPLGLDVLCLS